MSSTSRQFRFIDLPLELQREIFLTSGLEDMGSAIRLVRVSKRAYNWITPIIYDMVTLGSEDTALFLRTLASKPARFFATHVKCLCLSVSVKPTDAERILSVCSGVRFLAFWVNYLSALSIEAEHLRDLCQSSEKKLLSKGVSAWSTNLTHLDIVFWPEDDWHVVPDLSQLSALTHVGLWHPHGCVEENLVSEILSWCEQLKILLVVVHEDDMTHQPRSQDRRVVLMPYPATIVQDWEASFIGRANTWSRALESFLAKSEPKSVFDPNGHNSDTHLMSRKHYIVTAGDRITPNELNLLKLSQDKSFGVHIMWYSPRGD
ncbi:hypothetical protein AN958_09975 [Leucoagaricus sp. SymC.cos]|nr:hypothetical protein AN958_09975 [Leucoagaricus sp. SymC.cos]